MLKRGKGKNLHLRLLATAKTSEHAFTSSVYPIIHQEVNRNYDLSNGHLCAGIKLSEARFLIHFIEEDAVIVQGAKPRSQNTERRSRFGLFSGCFGLPQSRGRFASAAHPTARGTSPEPGTQPQGGGEGLAGFCRGNAPGTRWWLSTSQVPMPSSAICAVKIRPLYGSSDPGVIFLCKKTTRNIKRVVFC